MQVPTIHSRETSEPEEQGLGAYATGMIGASLLISALVWALAIAKLLDLTGLRAKSVWRRRLTSLDGIRSHARRN